MSVTIVGHFGVGKYCLGHCWVSLECLGHSRVSKYCLGHCWVSNLSFGSCLGQYVFWGYFWVSKDCRSRFVGCNYLYSVSSLGQQILSWLFFGQ